MAFLGLRDDLRLVRHQVEAGRDVQRGSAAEGSCRTGRRRWTARTPEAAGGSAPSRRAAAAAVGVGGSRGEVRREERVGEAAGDRGLRDDLALRGQGPARRSAPLTVGLGLDDETGLDPKLAHRARRAGEQRRAVGQQCEQGVRGRPCGQGSRPGLRSASAALRAGPGSSARCWPRPAVRAAAGRPPGTSPALPALPGPGRDSRRPWRGRRADPAPAAGQRRTVATAAVRRRGSVAVASRGGCTRRGAVPPSSDGDTGTPPRVRRRGTLGQTFSSRRPATRRVTGQAICPDAHPANFTEKSDIRSTCLRALILTTRTTRALAGSPPPRGRHLLQWSSSSTPRSASAADLARWSHPSSTLPTAGRRSRPGPRSHRR